MRGWGRTEDTERTDKASSIRRIVPFVAACVGAATIMVFAVTRIPSADAKAQEQETGILALEQATDPGATEIDPATAMGAIAEKTIYADAAPLSYSAYKVRKGDTVSELAERYSLNQDTILSFNGIRNSRLLQIGQYLMIPDRDGVLYDVRKGDSVDAIAERYEIDPVGIVAVNGIEGKPLLAGERLFLPEARLARVTLQEINGDLFAWPIRGYISSRYGYRTSPFTGERQFHSGLDIAAPRGTPIRAAMAGRVTATGYDANSGNYVVISHHSGYRTFYGHMDVIRVSRGEWIRDGQRIGDVGSTGLSTGSHLHFSVFKYGASVNPLNLMN